MYIYITYNPHDTLFQAHPDMFRATRNLSFGGALQRSRTVTAEAGVSPTSKVCIASRGWFFREEKSLEKYSINKKNEIQ